MSVFYFNRETGQRVSRSTWKRSHAQGGTRFVRRSSGPGQPKNPVKPETKNIQGDTTGSSVPTPSQNPRTYQEWKDYFQKLPKRTRRRLEEEDSFDGPEYETGVDY